MHNINNKIFLICISIMLLTKYAFGNNYKRANNKYQILKKYSVSDDLISENDKTFGQKYWIHLKDASDKPNELKPEKSSYFNKHTYKKIKPTTATSKINLIENIQEEHSPDTADSLGLVSKPFSTSTYSITPSSPDEISNPDSPYDWIFLVRSAWDQLQPFIAQNFNSQVGFPESSSEWWILIKSLLEQLKPYIQNIWKEQDTYIAEVVENAIRLGDKLHLLKTLSDKLDSNFTKYVSYQVRPYNFMGILNNVYEKYIPRESAVFSLLDVIQTKYKGLVNMFKNPTQEDNKESKHLSRKERSLTISRRYYQPYRRDGYGYDQDYGHSGYGGGGGSSDSLCLLAALGLAGLAAIAALLAALRRSGRPLFGRGLADSSAMLWLSDIPESISDALPFGTYHYNEDDDKEDSEAVNIINSLWHMKEMSNDISCVNGLLCTKLQNQAMQWHSGLLSGRSILLAAVAAMVGSTSPGKILDGVATSIVSQTPFSCPPVDHCNSDSTLRQYF